MTNQKKGMIVTIFFSLLFLATSGYLWYTNLSNEVEEPKEEEVTLKKESEEKEATIFVDIKGEVNAPGLYEMPTNKRVMDVITAAGGLTEAADTSEINLSKKIEDQMVIIVNKVGEKANESSLQNDARIDISQAVGSKKETSTKTSIISINNASKEELMTLNGIGNAKAEAIITYRNDHGGFKSIDELLEVKGIGESVFNKIKDHITL